MNLHESVSPAPYAPESAAYSLRVLLIDDQGRIVVEPVRRAYTMAELMENVTPEAMREAFDWGEDVGRERIDE